MDKDKNELSVLPGLTTFFAFMFAFEGMMNLERKDRMWHFASSDCACSSELAPAANVGFTDGGISLVIEPIVV